MDRFRIVKSFLFISLQRILLSAWSEYFNLKCLGRVTWLLHNWHNWQSKYLVSWWHLTANSELLFCQVFKSRKLILLYSHLHHHSASQRHNIKDRCMIKRRRKDFFRKIFTSHFIARVQKGYWKVTCERMLETEHKLHILTPLLWLSRCVFLVLLDAQPEVLGSTPSEVSEGPLGRVWPSLPHLVSGCLEICWQLLRGFSECPLGRVWSSLPHLVSNSLGVCWQLLWDPNSTELNNNSTPTRSPTGSLKSNV